MNLFDTKTRLFESEKVPATQTRGAYFPHNLKQYGSLSTSIQGIQAGMTGRKKLFPADIAATTANYYFRTNHAIASFVREVINNSVGTTLGTLQSKINAFDPIKNQELNQNIENAWYQFTKAEYFDLSGRFDLTEFLSQALTKLLIEGEMNIRIFNNMGKHYYQYQLLGFNTLDYTYHQSNIFNGVEINGYTKPIAYWIVDSDEKRYRIPANEFIHVANINDETEYRGTSYLSPAFQQLENIDTYEQAEITAAINEATMVLWYGSDAGKAYEGATDVSAIAGFNPNTQSNTATPSGYDPSAILAGSGIQHGGIAIESLPPNVKLNQLSSNHPNNGFSEALRMLYRNLGSALGLPLSTLLLDLSDSSYSSMRAGEIFKRKMYRKLSNILVSKLLEPIFKMWLTKYISTNKQLFPKVEGSYDAYFMPTFPLPKFSYIDPEKDVNADVIALENGLTTWSKVIAEQGEDFEDFLMQRKADEERASMIGVKLETKSDKTNAVELAKVQNINNQPQANEAS